MKEFFRQFGIGGNVLRILCTFCSFFFVFSPQNCEGHDAMWLVRDSIKVAIGDPPKNPSGVGMPENISFCLRENLCFLRVFFFFCVLMQLQFFWPRNFTKLTYFSAIMLSFQKPKNCLFDAKGQVF